METLMKYLVINKANDFIASWSVLRLSERASFSDERNCALWFFESSERAIHTKWEFAVKLRHHAVLDKLFAFPLPLLQ